MPLETAEVVDAFADAALLHLTELWVLSCRLTRTFAPALARLCASSTLTTLRVLGGETVLEDATTALAFADALRANTTLKMLELGYVGLWSDPAIGTSLIGALTGHISIQNLSLTGIFPAEQVDEELAAAGAALGALVAANAPALHRLDVAHSQLRDAGLGPLVDALPLNTHLTTLKLDGLEEAYSVSDAFARDRLLPAVRANTSLRELATGSIHECAAEAEQIVRQRAAAA